MDPLKTLTTKSGGAYIPRAKLRELLANSTISKQSKEYQKLQWEQLKKSINGLINKANVSNLRPITIDLFRLNLVRAKGVFVRSLMKAQYESYEKYTKVYAALITVINSKLPEVAELLIIRLILQFRRSFRRNDKNMCKAILLFLGELVNQEILDSILIFQIFYLLLDKNPTDDSVEISISLIEVISPYLELNSSKIINIVYDRLRQIIQEGLVSKRVQFIVEEMFNKRRERMNSDEDVEIIPKELDLVEFDDKFKHSFQLDEKDLKANEKLNVFQFDEDYEGTEAKYEKFKKELFGSDDDSGSESGSGGSDSEDDESEDDDDDDKKTDMVKAQIKDLTQTELTNYQKTVYLTIMSSMSHDEAAHKLLNLKPIDEDQKEYMLIDMIVKCCAQEKTYSKYYGLIVEKLGVINQKWRQAITQVFAENYGSVHRFNSNLIRNIGYFWGHMLASDKIDWDCLEVVKLTEEDSNSSSRILLKFIFQKLQQELGTPKLLERLSDSYIQKFIMGIFPETNADHLRFSINFFTAIGLGVLTEKMRQTLENLPPEEEKEEFSEDDEERGRTRTRRHSGSSSRSGSGSYSRSRSGSYSRSRSGSYSRSRSGSYSSRSYSSRSGSYSRSRSGSRSNSRSRTPSRGRSYSRSRTPSRGRSYSRSGTPSRSRSRSGSRNTRRSASFSRSRSGSRSRSRSISPNNGEDRKRRKFD